MTEQEADQPQANSGPEVTTSEPHTDAGAQETPGGASATGKADLGKRAVALIIDSIISGIISMVIPAVGGLIGAAYMLLRDGMEFDFMDSRSIGKKLMKLRPVTVDGSTYDLMTSVKRNWMFALGGLVPVLLFIPIFGWVLIPFVGLAALVLGVIEIVLVLTDAQGRRLGDKIANTKVIEVSG